MKSLNMSKLYKYPCVLTIAGTDPSGGAGIQADLKTFAALGCYGMSVITALTAQNTCGVKAIHTVPADFIEMQLETLLEDIQPDVIKIGMIHNIEQVNAITKVLQQYPDIPIIYDPVMISSSGYQLIEDDAVSAIMKKIFPLSRLITPNMDEASLLANMPVKTIEDMHSAGLKIMEMRPGALLLKGGHLESEQLTSLLFDASGGIEKLQTNKISTKNTHGTGCTLSSAIASYVALGLPLSDAVAQAQDYVYDAILQAADVLCGKGNGSLNHSYGPQKMIKQEIGK